MSAPRKLGVTVTPDNIDLLIKYGKAIRKAANEQIQVQHPELPHIKTVDLVEIFDKPSNSEVDYKNVVIFGDGQADRSPCGTGTCAKMATLYAKGELGLNQDFVYESIIGTTFKGRLVATTKVGDYDAVIPEITGAAYITGFNQFAIDPADPLKYGFALGVGQKGGHWRPLEAGFNRISGHCRHSSPSSPGAADGKGSGCSAALFFNQWPARHVIF